MPNISRAAKSERSRRSNMTKANIPRSFGTSSSPHSSKPWSSTSLSELLAKVCPAFKSCSLSCLKLYISPLKTSTSDLSSLNIGCPPSAKSIMLSLLKPRAMSPSTNCPDESGPLCTMRSIILPSTVPSSFMKFVKPVKPHIVKTPLNGRLAAQNAAYRIIIH